MKNYLSTTILFSTFLLSIAENVFSESSDAAERWTIFPPGIDSVVAQDAFRSLDQLFVNEKQMSIARDLIKEGIAYLNLTEEFYKILSVKRQDFFERQKTEAGISELAGLPMRAQKSSGNHISEDSLTISVVSNLGEYFLDYSENLFLRARRMNPFDVQCHQLLSRCYWDMGIIYHNTTAHQKAVQILMEYLKHDEGEASIYHQIGKNYYQLEEWSQAHRYFSKAVEISERTLVFDDDDTIHAENRKSARYLYLLDKAMAEIKIHQADSALESLNRACSMKPGREDSIRIQALREWILWDDGNIASVELRDVINDSLRSGNYRWAKDTYLRELIPRLQTQPALHDVIWRLSRIEYYFLEERESAAYRLFDLIKKVNAGSTTSGLYQPPQDSLYRVYFKDSGQMFFELAEDYRKKGRLKEARSFLVNDTTIEWAGRAKSFISLAMLPQQTDFSPDDLANLSLAKRKEIMRQSDGLSIQLFNRALSLKYDLTEKEIELAYSRLINLYKLTHPEKVPEVYQKWKSEKSRF